MRDPCELILPPPQQEGWALDVRQLASKVPPAEQRLILIEKYLGPHPVGHSSEHRTCRRCMGAVCIDRSPGQPLDHRIKLPGPNALTQPRGTQNISRQPG